MPIKITLSDIEALKPCWELERLRARVPSEGVTYTQIAQAGDVPVGDRRWLLTRLAAHTIGGRRGLVTWAAGCAQDVVHLITKGDRRDEALACIAAATAWAEDPCDVTRDAAAASAASASASAAGAADASADAYATWAAAYAAWAAADADAAASAAASAAADAAAYAAAAAWAATWAADTAAYYAAWAATWAAAYAADTAADTAADAASALEVES